MYLLPTRREFAALATGGAAVGTAVYTMMRVSGSAPGAACAVLCTVFGKVRVDTGSAELAVWLYMGGHQDKNIGGSNHPLHGCPLRFTADIGTRMQVKVEFLKGEFLDDRRCIQLYREAHKLCAPSSGEFRGEEHVITWRGEPVCSLFLVDLSSAQLERDKSFPCKVAILTEDGKHLRGEVYFDLKLCFEAAAPEPEPEPQTTLEDISQQVSELAGELVNLTTVQSKQTGSVEQTLAMVSSQSAQLTKMDETTAAIFQALKSLSEHKHDVPTLVVIKLKDAPEWKGALHDNIGSNLGNHVKSWTGTHKFLELRFLCEKTLLPVSDEDGGMCWELKMTNEDFARFLKAAGPVLSATIALLKLAALVVRPVARIAGFDLPEISAPCMDVVRDVKVGESTVGEAFADTGITNALDGIDALGQRYPDPEPEAEAEAEAGQASSMGEPLEPEVANGRVVQLWDFAGDTIMLLDADNEDEEEAVGAEPGDRLRVSLDTIKAWIKEACENAAPKRESDLEQGIIGGLQKTVLTSTLTSADGRVSGRGETMWLCQKEAERHCQHTDESPVADGGASDCLSPDAITPTRAMRQSNPCDQPTSPEKRPEPEPEPEPEHIALSEAEPPLSKRATRQPPHKNRVKRRIEGVRKGGDEVCTSIKRALANQKTIKLGGSLDVNK